MFVVQRYHSSQPILKFYQPQFEKRLFTLKNHLLFGAVVVSTGISCVIDALFLVVERGLNEGVIQIGTEEATIIKEASEIIVEISNNPIKINFDRSMP